MLKEYQISHLSSRDSYLKIYQDEINNMQDHHDSEIKLSQGIYYKLYQEHKSLTNQLKQLESQLLAQKTLNEVTVEYLEEKLKKAENLLRVYYDMDCSDDNLTNNGYSTRQYFSDKDGKDNSPKKEL
jgi:hypothetical protein